MADLDGTGGSPLFALHLPSNVSKTLYTRPKIAELCDYFEISGSATVGVVYWLRKYILCNLIVFDFSFSRTD
jgi:hypothetical protein